MELVWSKFHFFRELKMLEFCGFHGFLGGFSALESQTEMMVPNFMPFCYWKSSKFVENLKIHVLSSMQNGQFCSVPQAHWVCLNKCIIGFQWKAIRKGALLSILKILKKKARGFPSHAQGKRIDSGVCSINIDFYLY